MLYKGEFLKFVCDTAVDGIGKVIAHEGEKVSRDYKILRNLRCKGGQPASITVKIQSENPILNSMDPQKHETNLQKEVMSQSKQALDQKKLEKVNEEDKEDESEDDEDELKRVEGISTPKHKVVYSYPVDISD